jgi:riboflavin biosynthesis pyrimidine reductase
VADNPALTVRRVKGSSPARIVIDPNRRVDISSKVFADDGQTVIIVGPSVAGDSSDFRYIPPNGDGAYPPTWIAEQLGVLGFKRLLIEGGATTVSRFVADRAVDRLHILTGPIIIGSGPAGLSLPEISNLRDAIRPETTTYPFEDGDVLFDCKFHRDTER